MRGHTIESFPIELKSLGMFSLHQRSPIRNNRRAPARPRSRLGFISAMRITMLLFHPVSYRVGHHRHRSISLGALALHSCHSPVLSVSFHPRRTTAADITHREFQRLLQFPLNRISFTGQQRDPRDGRATKRYFYYSPYYVRTRDIYQSRLFQLAFPFLGLAMTVPRFDTRALGWNARDSYHAC